MTTTEKSEIQSLKKSSMWRGIVQTVIGGLLLFFVSRSADYLSGIQEELKLGREKDSQQDSRLDFLEAKDRLEKELMEKLEADKKYNSGEIKKLIDSLNGGSGQSQRNSIKLK